MRKAFKLPGSPLLDDLQLSCPDGWKPDEFPILDGIDEIYMDCESTGLRWWEKARPIGSAVGWFEGDRFHKRYLPWGHRGGGNHCEETAKRWHREQLKHKRINNHNIKFDNHQYYAWGVDLEEQGCILGDSSHWAALLDDHRTTFSLEALSQEFLGRGKVKGIDATRMAEYAAWQVADYATTDVELVALLKQKMWPLMDEQELHEVRRLEEDCIYATCEMERNGVHIDEELLERWLDESEQEMQRCFWEVYRETGLKVNPDSSVDMAKLFASLGIEITQYTDTGRPSFADEVLERVQHPMVQKIRRAGKIASLRSKALLTLKHGRCSDGLMRYALHQLRAEDEYGRRKAGTISGRYSSTKIDTGVGWNIQQVMSVGNQREAFGYDEDDGSHDDEIYIIRQLVKPAPGKLWLSADAAQIEYRLFGHYSRSPRIIQRYKDDPRTKFHDMVLEWLRPRVPITYKRTKNLNFAEIYGAGFAKKAFMLKFITEAQLNALKRQYAPRGVPPTEPLLKETVAIQAIYDQELPEVKPLQRLASKLAAERGYVKTLSGRRIRFPKVDKQGNPIPNERRRLHKSVNGVIQGSAADIMKRKNVELHRARKRIGYTPRLTVHDETGGDCVDQESARMVAEILDRQSYELLVQILWDVQTGNNWRDCA